jgi:hypothetical protein
MTKRAGHGARLAFAEFFVSCGVALRGWEQQGPRGRRIHIRGKVVEPRFLPPRQHDRMATKRRITSAPSRAAFRRRTGWIEGPEAA